MTVDEAKVAKAVLEQTLARALRQFSAETGLVVEALDFESFPLMQGGSAHYVVKVVAKV